MEEVKSSGFFWTWSSLGLFVCILIWFLPWRFQVNDDQIMMWLVSGAYTGTPETYAVYIHPILSWCFATLYSAFPISPWYPIIWFLVIYLSFVSCIYVITKEIKEKYFQFLLVSLILGISIHFLFFLQFTQVAGLVSFSGFLLIITHSNSRKKLVIGSILIGLGFLIRFEAAVLMGIGVVLYLPFKFKSKILIHHYFKMIPAVVLGLVLFLSKSLWERNSVYPDFLAFNKARSGVLDHPVFYRHVHENQLKVDSDWFYLSRWYFEESEIDITELIGKKSELDSEFYSLAQIKNTFRRIFVIQKAEAFKSFLAIVIIGIYFLMQETKSKWFLALWLGLFLVLNHFFLFYGRVNVLFFVVLLIPLIINESNVFNRKYLMGINLIIVIAVIYHTNNFLKEGAGRKVMRDEMLALISDIPETEPIFLEGYQEHMLGLEYNSKNLVQIINQGWLSRSPYQKKIFKRFKIDSLSGVKSYSLMAIQMEEPLVFPDYMETLNSDFRNLDKRSSTNFQLSRFTSVPIEEH